MTTSPGAEAPKWSMATVSSAYRSQPNGLAASTARRGTPLGSTPWPVAVGLGGEEIPGREGDHPGGHPSGRQQLGGGHAQLDLAAGADEHHLGLALGARST